MSTITSDLSSTGRLNTKRAGAGRIIRNNNCDKDTKLRTYTNHKGIVNYVLFRMLGYIFFYLLDYDTLRII